VGVKELINAAYLLVPSDGAGLGIAITRLGFGCSHNAHFVGISYVLHPWAATVAGLHDILEVFENLGRLHYSKTTGSCYVLINVLHDNIRDLACECTVLGNEVEWLGEAGTILEVTGAGIVASSPDLKIIARTG
jgi:hypothetical protein